MTRTETSPTSSSQLRRDNKKLALLILALTAVSGALILLSFSRSTWASNSRGPHRDMQTQAGVAQPAFPSSQYLPGGAHKVAAAWIKAYGTTHFRDSMQDAIEGLRRYSTPRLLGSLTSNSGAEAFLQRRRRRKLRTVVHIQAVHSQDNTATGSPVVVIYKYTTLTPHARSSELRTSTLDLVYRRGHWLVDEMLVP